MNKRIENLEFMPAVYLLPKERWPEHIAYDIVFWRDNLYYGKEDEYPECPTDSSFRIYPDYPSHKIHKSCFKHPEINFTLACFKYNEHEGFYELEFCMDRPIKYLDTPEKREAFWELVKYGDTQLNNNE